MMELTDGNLNTVFYSGIGIGAYLAWVVLYWFWDIDYLKKLKEEAKREQTND